MTFSDTLRAFDGIVRTLEVRGARSGSLAGTAFVAKDLYDVRGVRTGAGNPDWQRTHAEAASTAPVIERLLRAGATLVGKSCTDELAFSLDGVNVHYGTPVNPKFPQRLPGGSSSGSASAVAAGLVDFALGTDTSGSIRVPASYCGICGFRPSHGALPMDGIVPLARSFDTPGWLARDARMLARCGRVLLEGAGPTHDGAREFDTLVVLDDAFDMVHAAQIAPLRTAADTAARLFSRARGMRLGARGLGPWRDAFSAVKQWEAWHAHGRWIREVNPDFAANIRANFESASRVTAEERHRALAERERLCAALWSGVGPASVLCLPTAWTIAPLKTAPAEELADNRMKDLTLGAVASLAGAPQVSLPVAGSAVSLSLVAAPGRDLRLLALADSVADAIGP